MTKTTVLKPALTARDTLIKVTKKYGVAIVATTALLVIVKNAADKKDEPDVLFVVESDGPITKA